jgi:hypothetical protein
MLIVAVAHVIIALTRKLIFLRKMERSRLVLKYKQN